MKINILYLLTALLIISGCARPYHKINITTIPFKEYREESKISYSVRQGVMYNMRNFLYAKKELRKNVAIMAFKIVNKSALPININDLQFSCGASVPIAPIKTKHYYDVVKQKSNLYWLYSAGVIVYPKPAVTKDANGIQVNKPDNPKKFIKNGKQYIPIPFGLPIAAANYGVAHKANKKLLLDLELLDLTNKVIQPGDSISGILPFENVTNCGDIFITVKE